MKRTAHPQPSIDSESISSDSGSNGSSGIQLQGKNKTVFSDESNMTTDSRNLSPVSSYQHISDEDGDMNGLNGTSSTVDTTAARWSMLNFVLMSVLFSANHGCIVSCLSLATSQLGDTGAWQSGLLYLTYTASALLGATYLVKKLGARNALVAGMTFYCFYVACFVVAVRFPKGSDAQRSAALAGAAIGGIGAGFLWTAQGSYFSSAASDHARYLGQPVPTSTASLAGIFAFLYLAEEVLLRLLSTVLLQFGVAWGVIFGVYTVIAIVTTLGMLFVHDYGSEDAGREPVDGTVGGATRSQPSSVWYKVTAAWQLLIHDPKMKYMIGLNAVFGFTSAFLNSYVNGQVLPVVLNDPDGKYIGVLSSWVSGVAALMSLILAKVSSNDKVGKGPVLIAGALCFMGVVIPFLVAPTAATTGTDWGWPLMLFVYSLHGTGRATFESTLKATFADFFPYEREGAFANIILQNGLSGAIGYVLTFRLLCSTEGPYCVPFKNGNGTLHDVLSFELLVVFSAIIAILGYLRASSISRSEQNITGSNESAAEDNTGLLHNEEGETA